MRKLGILIIKHCNSSGCGDLFAKITSFGVEWWWQSVMLTGGIEYVQRSLVHTGRGIGRVFGWCRVLGSLLAFTWQGRTR